VVRRIAVEDLADRAQAGIRQVIGDRRQTRQRRLGVAADSVLRQGIVTQQPGPYRALMIGVVAPEYVAPVVALVVRVVRVQCAQAVGA